MQRTPGRAWGTGPALFRKPTVPWCQGTHLNPTSQGPLPPLSALPGSWRGGTMQAVPVAEKSGPRAGPGASLWSALSGWDQDALVSHS